MGKWEALLVSREIGGGRLPVVWFATHLRQVDDLIVVNVDHELLAGPHGLAPENRRARHHHANLLRPRAQLSLRFSTGTAAPPQAFWRSTSGEKSQNANIPGDKGGGEEGLSLRCCV